MDSARRKPRALGSETEAHDWVGCMVDVVIDRAMSIAQILAVLLYASL